MDERYITEGTNNLYQYSFRQYLEDIDAEHFPSPVDDIPDLTDYQEERLNDLRFGIKKDRDTYFVENVYDDLDIDNIPRDFWLTDHEQDRQQKQLDDYAQSAVQEYLTD